jgi:putative inorganic carbon (HCO3(-)) transporter
MKVISREIPGVKVDNAVGRGEFSNKIFYGLLVVFMLEYFRPNNYLPFLNTLKINTIVPIGVFLFTVLSRRGPGISIILRDRITKLLLFFLLLLFGSVVTADVTFYSYKVFISVLGYCFVYFSARQLLTNIKRFRQLFGCYIAVHIILVLFNPAVILNPESRNYLMNAPFLGDGNDFALSVCTVIPMAYFFVVTEKHKPIRMLSILALVFMSLCVIGTQSRGGTIALCLMGLYLWGKSKRKFFGIALIALMLLVGLAYAPPQYFQRMDRIVNYEQDGSALGRLLAWQSAIRMALDNPLLGVGSGHFPVKYGTEYRPPGYGRTDLPWQTAHSMYFLALGELGFPGLIFILTFIISIFVAVERRIRTLRGLMGAYWHLPLEVFF